MSGLLENAVKSLEAEGVVNLEYELDDVLSNIAFGGKADDLSYINRERRRIKRKYSDLVESIGEISFTEESSPILLALDNIRRAYFGLVSPLPLWGEMTPTEREEEAEDILGEHFFLTPESLSLAVEISRLGDKAYHKKKNLKIYSWSLHPDGDFELDYEIV